MSAEMLRWNAEKKEAKYNSKCILYYLKASLQYNTMSNVHTYIHTYTRVHTGSYAT